MMIAFERSRLFHMAYTRTKKSRKKKSWVFGFTLIEVLVSMAVISLVVVSLYRVLAGNMDLTGAGRFYQTALLLAEKQLVQVTADFENYQDDQGRFDPPFDDYAWSSRILPVEWPDAEGPEDEAASQSQGQGNSGLMKVQIEISRISSHRKFFFETFRFNDGISDE